jgi:hypothetical protein
VRACHYHEDRPAVGICMRCRRAICAGCTTRLDGVNHCHQCLKKLSRAAAEAPGAAISGVSVGLAVLLVGFLFLFLECLFLVEGRLAP